MKATVQIYAPLHHAPGSYDWVSVGDVDVTSLDIDHLKERAMSLITEHGYVPTITLTKIVVEEKNMEIMLTEL